MCEQFLNVRNTEVSYAKLPLIIDMYIYIYMRIHICTCIYLRASVVSFQKRGKPCLKQQLLRMRLGGPRNSCVFNMVAKAHARVGLGSSNGRIVD